MLSASITWLLALSSVYEKVCSEAVWRSFPCESVNDMFSNTFSNDLTVRSGFLTRKNLSEFTGITQAPWLPTQWCCSWSHTASTTVEFLLYSSSGDDYMKALCNKISRHRFLSPNKMSGRQFPGRALPRHGRSALCTGQNLNNRLGCPSCFSGFHKGEAPDWKTFSVCALASPPPATRSKLHV